MPGQSGDRRSVARWAGKQAVFCLLVAAALFWPAGGGWPAAWLYLILCAGTQVLTAVVLVQVSPELLADRSGMPPGAKPYDIPLALLMGYSPLFLALAAGLEHGRGGQLGLPAAASAVALVLALAGIALTIRAMAANRFFSAVVAIQSERGHTVAAGGPYRWVRHPGYSGMLLFTVASPAVLDSGWTLVVALCVVGLSLLRTAQEDQTLQAELPGYREYAARVRWRLIPGLW